jgi:hypothetical protein
MAPQEVGRAGEEEEFLVLGSEFVPSSECGVALRLPRTLNSERNSSEGPAIAVRYLELELEYVRPLTGSSPPVRDPLSFALPADRVAVVCDRPESALFRLVRIGESEAILPHPANFHPRLVADDGEGNLLVVGAGPGHNAVLLGPDGGEVRRFDLGPGVSDVCYDPDGNLVVLRAMRRGPKSILDRFGPEGDRVEKDESIRRIMDHTSRTSGRMLLIQRDGTVWLDLAEKYDVDGALLDVIEPAEVFGPGRISADRFGWDGVVVLSERGALTALLPHGRKREFRIPEKAVTETLGRPLSAEHDLIATREEHLVVLATDHPTLLGFRMLWE